MITINEALSLIKLHVHPLLKETYKPLEKAGSYRLSQTILSTINMPPFRQSAMDGYALNIHDELSYQVLGEVKAGDDHTFVLKKGEAVRIFTGAPVPDSSNAVIMQEKVVAHGNLITIENQIALESNIRPLGEQVKIGEVALKKNTKLTPAAIGYLLSLGITEVPVYKKPTIAIVTTGNELMEPGQPLTHGKIYESNSKMLLSALYNLKFYDVKMYNVEDDYNKTVQTLDNAIQGHDLVLITGGISVGDYDFVGKALKVLQVETLFYKVKQKPGKPLFYGKKEETQVFALPGNPAAALTCFYIYVHLALQKMMHQDVFDLPRINAKSTSHFLKRGDRPQFLKALYNGKTVQILEGQNSSMLQTFAISNALVYVPAEISEIKKGDDVKLIKLPI